MEGGWGFCGVFLFFNDTATTEIYTLSLHDALPICKQSAVKTGVEGSFFSPHCLLTVFSSLLTAYRSEEHTSELQSHSDLVCRLLLEKKKKIVFHTSLQKKKKKKIEK